MPSLVPAWTTTSPSTSTNPHRLFHNTKPIFSCLVTEISFPMIITSTKTVFLHSITVYHSSLQFSLHPTYPQAKLYIVSSSLSPGIPLSTSSISSVHILSAELALSSTPSMSAKSALNSTPSPSLTSTFPLISSPTSLMAPFIGLSQIQIPPIVALCFARSPPPPLLNL